MVSQKYSAMSVLTNASRLRFLVALCILFILWWTVLGVLERKAVRVEQEGARLMLNQIRSMLVVRGAEIRLQEGPEFREWAGRNPFDWFESKPARYSGHCPEGRPELGHWCFRPFPTGGKGYKNSAAGEQGEVIFQPRQPITLGERQGSDSTALGWVVGVEFSDRNGNERLDDEDLQSGLRLKPVEAGMSTEDRGEN